VMSSQKKVLVAEDEVATHEEWRDTLASWGYRAETVEDGQRALEVLTSFNPDILLCDLRMPRKDGLELLQDIRQLGLDPITIVISGAGDIPDAVKAIKLGAFDYLPKPIDLPRLEQLLRNLANHVDLRRENLILRRQLWETGEQGPLVGRSLAMRRVINTIGSIAGSAVSVVITGESGTGKEVAARAIHQLSRRKNETFLAINCAALAESLMESELFGHERGAFTGANERRKGYFELADGGTLLLDEITEMKPEMQAKLLRVLEERKLRRVGGSAEISFNVRVLASSNRNLEQSVREGRLREDLYYRLNVFTVEMPPLRERPEDIPFLIDFFMRQFGEREQALPIRIEDEVLALLNNYSWPGTVRELRNAIERAVVVARGSVIGVNDLPASIAGGRQEPSVEPRGHGQVGLKVGVKLKDAEQELVMRTIDFVGGNKRRAAAILGISARTLYNYLERYQEKAP
ncbi:MAG: sigma-54-dependent transcriptional regulator, partial [Candidatus Binataceae bacterium]